MSGGNEFIWEGRGGGGRNARYTQFAGHAADDLRLSGLHFRVLAHLGRFNQNKGWVRLSQKELAERFDVRRPSINKAIGQLIEFGYVEKRSQEESGESFCYYRTIIDHEGVSAVGDTPKQGGVSATGDTGVSSSDTRVSPPKTHKRSSSNIVEDEDPPLPPKGGDPVNNRSDRKARPAQLPKFVSEAALDQVKTLAPLWDRQALLVKFLAWPGSKNARNMDKAFLGWVKTFTKGKPPA